MKEARPEAKQEVPRYEVIADYPNSPLKIGDIIELNETYRGLGAYLSDEVWESHYFFEDYPHIFRNLPTPTSAGSEGEVSRGEKCYCEDFQRDDCPNATTDVCIAASSLPVSPVEEEKQKLRDFTRFIFMAAQQGGGYNKEAEDYFIDKWDTGNFSLLKSEGTITSNSTPVEQKLDWFYWSQQLAKHLAGISATFDAKYEVTNYTKEQTKLILGNYNHFYKKEFMDALKQGIEVKEDEGREEGVLNLQESYDVTCKALSDLTKALIAEKDLSARLVKVVRQYEVSLRMDRLRTAADEVATLLNEYNQYITSKK